MAQHCIDPVTRETLDEPVLASDGETYSRRCLELAMAADGWKRSPVTREVLRTLAYPNVFARRVLGCGSVTEDRTPVQIYDVSTYSPPASGRNVTWSLPAHLGAADTMVRRRFGIHDGAFTVTATLLRDEAGNDWLMHPPCAAEMRHDILALARVVGATRLVSNPWCLTWAVLNTGVTVEAQWVAARRQAAADGGGGGYASPV